MNLVGITKSKRSEYDHVMLKIHDAMKADDEYQRTMASEPVNFMPGSIWVCFADSVSHSVHSGQHMFEQKDSNKAPLRILEKMRGQSLA
jgi:hydroxyacyl-ACP dehydratase HTD2-like protein with hotdog domain